MRMTRNKAVASSLKNSAKLFLRIPTLVFFHFKLVSNQNKGSRGVARIFQRRAHCVRQRVLVSFRYLNIVSCLLQKSLTKNRCAQDFISLYDVSNLFRGWPASNATINFRNIGDVNHLAEQSVINYPVYGADTGSSLITSSTQPVGSHLGFSFGNSAHVLPCSHVEPQRVF